MDGNGKSRDHVREKALRVLEKQGVRDTSLYSASLEDLVQELSVYQIELEHQNEELKKTQVQLETSRDRLYDLYHNAPAGYVTINADHEVEEINRTACRMLGMDSPSGTAGERFTRFIHPEDQDIFYFHFKQSAGKVAPVLCELRLLPQKGEEPIAVRLESIGEPQGEGVEGRRIRSTITDLTEIKRLQQAADRAEKIESLGMLAGNIAHEFNNLFTAVFGYISLAKMDLPPAHGAYEHLERAEKAISDARELTGRLLTFSKGGSPVIRRLDLARLAAHTIEQALADAPVEILLNAQENLWTVLADRDQTRQLIANLAANAKDAMPEGGSLQVELANAHMAGDSAASPTHRHYVRISIKDEGPGIARENLERVFDPYFTTREEAAGLGLTIAHSIVSRHNGHMEMHSNPGQGAEVVVYLPAEGSPETGAGEGPESSGAQDAAESIHCRVLVMDDDPAVRAIAKKMLEKQGCSAAVAAEGGEALRMYRDSVAGGSRFDAVILDVAVKTGLGGKDTAKELKAVDPHATLIVSSGYTSDPVLADPGAHGFAAALEKPYQLEKLKAVLKNVLHGPARQQQP
jgi:signal transduction histidine kinase/ActR/RegA family two-component response regulator